MPNEINNKKIYGVGSSGCVKSNETFYHVINIDNNGIVSYEKIIINYDREQFENILNNINYPDKDFISKVFFGI